MLQFGTGCCAFVGIEPRSIRYFLYPLKDYMEKSYALLYFSDAYWLLSAGMAIWAVLVERLREDCCENLFCGGIIYCYVMIGAENLN